MIILDNSKSLSVLASDITNGLGQIEPLEGVVTEELNGIYEAEFSVLTSDRHYEDLKRSGLVKIEVEDGSKQIFRVYEWGEEINFTVKVKAQHITYDLNKVTVKPFQATGAVNTKNQLLSHVLGNYPFTMSTDISNTTSVFTLDIPKSWRECLGGYEGSLLDVFRGEYEWDNLEVKMLAHRGSDKNVRIAYGKNLTDFRQEQNNENVYDGVYGYAVVDDVTYEASDVYNKTGVSSPKILNVDFSNRYESGEIPTSAELLQYATDYATNNDIEIPRVNINVSFVPLWQTDEYKDILPLERVGLGDTVHVFFDQLNVEASARVIKTTWNINTKKYDSIELGDARANLNTVINDSVTQAVEEAVGDIDLGAIESDLMNVSTLVANGMGLHISKDSNGVIILHNADTIAGSQYQYKISSNGFALSEDYGQSWTSGWDISGNAVLNSLSTITLKALEIYGSYIEGSQILFGDHSDKYILAQVYNDGNDDVGVTFDGSGYVRFQPQEQFVVNNVNANSNLLNEFVMGSKGTNNQPYVVLKNYDHTHNYILANAIEMDAAILGVNTLKVTNYDTASGASIVSNQLNFRAGVPNQLEIRNNKKSSSLAANDILMRSYTGMTTNFRIENYDDESDNYANVLSFASNLNNGFEHVNLINYKKNSTSKANEIEMIGMPMNSSGYNTLNLYNYDVDGNNTAQRITMAKSSNDNSLTLDVLRGGSSVAYINVGRLSSGKVYINLHIRNNSTYGYTESRVNLDSDGKIYLSGTGLYWNGSQKW